ncbi:7434_t:CDS:2, partial [Racocetra persica]
MALGESSCKHQAVVAIKYHSGSFNYIATLALEDCMTYRYIACDELNTEVIIESSQN